MRLNSILTIASGIIFDSILLYCIDVKHVEVKKYANLDMKLELRYIHAC